MPELIRSCIHPVQGKRRRAGPRAAVVVGAQGRSGRRCCSTETEVRGWCHGGGAFLSHCPGAEQAEQRSWRQPCWHCECLSLCCCTLRVCHCRVQFHINFRVVLCGLWRIYLCLMLGRMVSAHSMALVVRDERYKKCNSDPRSGNKKRWSTVNFKWTGTAAPQSALTTWGGKG